MTVSTRQYAGAPPPPVGAPAGWGGGAPRYCFQQLLHPCGA